MMNNYCIVVANEEIAKELYNLQGNENFTAEELSLYLGFDTKNSPEQQVELVKDLDMRLKDLQLNGYARSEGQRHQGRFLFTVRRFIFPWYFP